MKRYNVTVAFTDGEEKNWYDVTDLQTITNGLLFMDDNKTVTVIAMHVKYTEIEMWEDETPTDETPTDEAASTPSTPEP